jgi:uncharacterized protein (TIGR00730 family)
MSESNENHEFVPTDSATLAVVEKALFELWEVANQLSRIRPARDQYYRVCLFGSARIEKDDPLYGDVRDLTQALAERGCDIVTGGGPGLMAAANEGERLGDPNGRTRSIGVRVDLPFEQGANPFVEKLYRHRTFFTRLHQFVRLSSAFVIVGGGIGTLLEAAMIWQLLQVRHVTNVPLIFVGEQWRELLEWAHKHMISGHNGFASAEDLAIPTCVCDIKEVVAVLEPHIQAFQK